VSNPSLSWNLVSDLRELLAYPFMVQALAAGTIAAILSGVLGWYMVLRRQTFAGHTLSTMSFPGAAAGMLVALPAALGYYVACVIAALAMARRPDAHDGGGGIQSARIGTIQAVGLAAGFLLLALSHSILGGLDDLLFGSFLGITPMQVWTLAIVAVVVLGILAVIGRPLLFVSLDPEAAYALGVPVRALETTFLLMLALTVAATTQITGALLVFALLVSPPAAALRLAARPIPSLLLSVGCAVAVIWCALVAAYFTTYPLGFYTTTFAFGFYLAAVGAQQLMRARTGPVTA
jgi:zinc/manganese transport system permease protein